MSREKSPAIAPIPKLIIPANLGYLLQTSGTGVYFTCFLYIIKFVFPEKKTAKNKFTPLISDAG